METLQITTFRFFGGKCGKRESVELPWYQGFRMSSCQSIILKEAYKAASWLDLYLIHKRYRLSPFQISEVCDRLSQDRIIETDGRKVRLTDEGKIWVLRNRRSLFSSERPWAKPSSYLLTTEMPPEVPYLPNLSLLEDEFFLNMLPKEVNQGNWFPRGSTIVTGGAFASACWGAR